MNIKNEEYKSTCTSCKMYETYFNMNIKNVATCM